MAKAPFSYVNVPGTIFSIVLFVLAIIGLSQLEYSLSFLSLPKWAEWLLFFGFLYLFAQALAALFDLLQGQYKPSLKNFCLLWLGYLLVTGASLLLLFMALPILVLGMLMGPVAFFAFIVGGIMTFLFLAQTLLGFELVGDPPTGIWALGAILAFLFGAGVLYWQIWVRDENERLTDGFIDWFVRYFSGPAKQKQQHWIEKLD